MGKNRKKPLIKFLIGDSPNEESLYTVFTEIIAKRYGLRPEEIEVILQDSVIRVIESGEKNYNGTAHPKTYLFRIIENLYIESKRREVIEKKYILNLIENPKPTNNPNPLEILVKEEEKQIITESLSQLPPHYQQALELYSEGFTYKEMADMTKTTVSILKNTLPAAKTKIKEILSRRHIQ